MDIGTLMWPLFTIRHISRHISPHFLYCQHTPRRVLAKFMISNQHLYKVSAVPRRMTIGMNGMNKYFLTSTHSPNHGISTDNLLQANAFTVSIDNLRYTTQIILKPPFWSKVTQLDVQHRLSSAQHRRRASPYHREQVDHVWEFTIA